MRSQISRLAGVLLFLLMHICSAGYSQLALFNLETWHNKLSMTKDSDNSVFNLLYRQLSNEDTLTIIHILDQLQSKIPASNHYYKARVYSMSASLNHKYKLYESKSEIITLAGKAVNEAYETNDYRFIALITWWCGSLMTSAQELELAVTYRLKAEEIYSKVGYADYDSISNWALIGEVLFHCRDYEKSIFYSKKALTHWKDQSTSSDYYRIRYYNTIAQGYEQLGKLDSAIVYLDTSFALAVKINNDTWKGINSGFKGQILFKLNEYNKARPLLENDYAINKKTQGDIAAKSLQWLARINLSEGRKDSALIKARESVHLVKQFSLGYYLQQKRYLEMCYYTLAETFRSIGNTDSFYFYNQLYSQLHDSIQNVVAQSNTRLVQMKIDNENILLAIETLQKEKRNEEMTRNLVIVVLVLLAAMAMLYFNWIKLKQRHREEIVLREKRMAETELASAREQMQQFTENIIEKSDLIDRLQQKIAGKGLDGENQQIVEDITRHTILTEADWENFKQMFEKLYPGFFTSLKEKAPNITIAEQRMAALTRLNLNSKQIASMLGISVDSVHKTKQRLRQRLQVQNESNLEETLSFL